MTLLLLIGTRKGAFVASSDDARRHWRLDGPFLTGAQIDHLAWLTTPEPTIVAAAKSEWWGPTLRLSRDLGRTWTEPGAVRFDADRGRTVDRIWIVQPGRSVDGAPAIFAGVDPGALFSSPDGGATWHENQPLTDHPSRERWQPGAGGLMVHSVCQHPDRPGRLLVGISAAGAFRSDDGGASWTPKNHGVRADFLPDTFPEVGQCVHHMEMHPADPDRLYQQNHCGVYRSDDAGDTWSDISEGLPSRFGFPLVVHPRDPDTVYVVPEESDERRLTPDGAFRVYRSRDGGHRWEPLTRGLPQANAFVNVLRHAAAADDLDPAGIYVGTQGGQIVASRDEGDSWDVIANWLPPVYSLTAATLD